MKLVSWNVNSIRTRLEHFRRLAAEQAPDIICLQETKARDEDFPIDAVRAAGFPHIYLRGMKSYNGVAIVSRRALADVDSREWVGRADCRHLSARLADGTVLHNFYIPAGGDVPDPSVNDKFAHKLAFLDEMTDRFAAGAEPGQRMILVGDLNIAPLESDVWSSRQLRNTVSHTDLEREKLIHAQQSGGWQDVLRHFTPAPARLYSWWSYRARDWRLSDRGRRLDHIWATPPLLAAARDARVLEEVRGWPSPSDHAPVLAEFAL